MSLVLAARDAHGDVWIGADSRSSSNAWYCDDADKLIPQNHSIIGFAGSTRIGQLIRFNPDRFPSITDLASAFAWTNILRQVLIDHGYQERASNGGEPNHDQLALIIATADAIYEVQANHQVRPITSVTAIGSGYAYGLGAYAAQPVSTPTELRVHRAIEVAAQNIASVGGPIQVRRVT